MYRIAAALLIFLSGCGNSDDAPSASLGNHGYGFAYDAMGPGGMMLRKAGATPHDAQVLETRARNVAICAGDDPVPPPPFVIFVAPGTLEEPFDGFYFSNPPLILLEDHFLLEHETMHYLLDRHGDLDPHHTSALWVRCFIPAGVPASP